MTRIMALDISGAATGWAFGIDRNLKGYGKFISNLNAGKGERLYDFALWIGNLFETYQPEIVLIERPFLGRNSNVLANLSKFIAVAELQAFQFLGLDIEDEWFMDPKKVKNLLNVKKPKGAKSTKQKYDNNKKLMVQCVNKLYGLRLKYTKNKSKKHNDDDIADAIGIWSAWWKLKEKKER
jgi:Holliday junction resolvasome RuvABC endonuclease subunit